MARLRLCVPLLLFAALLLLLARGLRLDPQALPSALLGQPFPEFRLPALGARRLLGREDVLGEPALFNVWATWCPPCRAEHPVLLRLAAAGVPIVGINYKDDARAARDWLRELGDPYREHVVDERGELGLELGVYGAPETYLVDSAGVIRYRHAGALDEDVWARRFEPLFRELP